MTKHFFNIFNVLNEYFFNIFYILNVLNVLNVLHIINILYNLNVLNDLSVFIFLSPLGISLQWFLHLNTQRLSHGIHVSRRSSIFQNLIG